MGSRVAPPTDVFYFEYLFFYLSNVVSLNVDKESFTELFVDKTWSSYNDLLEFLVEFLFINPSDLMSHKERIIAEYIAFKRFYCLVISEYGYTK
jgi:hypothetical protein